MLKNIFVFLNKPAERQSGMFLKKRIFIFGFLFCCFIFSQFVVVKASAQSYDPESEAYGLESNFSEVSIKSERDLKSTIALVINIVLGFLGIIAVILILYAGYMWMTANGNDEQVAKAKMIMRNAIIGLAIILSSWAIASFVIAKLREAQGGDGSGGGGSGGGGSSLPQPGAFILESFETSHTGADSKQNVHLCSSIQAQFNHWLKSSVFENLKDGDTLTIKRIIPQGGYSDVRTLVIELRNNVISFKNRENDGAIVDWTPNSQYEVRISKSLEDSSGKRLEQCSTCSSESNDRYRWVFTTGTTRDSEPPRVVSAYPSDESQNVPRSVIFKIDFSESIDVSSVIGADGKLDTSKISLQKLTSVAASTYDAPFAGNLFDVSIKGNSLLFSLNENFGSGDNKGNLDPYTVYRLTISNVEDLCGNRMTGPVVIDFETGSDVPGVSFVRPSDGFKHACPDSQVFVMFKTSMYNVRNLSCGVNAQGTAGLVLGGNLSNASPVINLKNYPEDNFTGSGNPNDYCKQYNFNLSNNLIPGSEYEALVNYIKPGGDVTRPDSKTWRFSVASATSCASEPYISKISPNSGYWGRCLTVSGSNFGSIKGASSVFGTLDLESSLNGSPVAQAVSSSWGSSRGKNMSTFAWGDSSISADFIRSADITELLPDSSSLGHQKLGFEVFVKVSYSAPIGELTSNKVDYVLTDRNSVYNGPCIDSISPSSGYWGDDVEIKGRRLGPYDEQDSVVFYDNKTIVPPFLARSSTSIKTKVPNHATENPSPFSQEVYVRINGQNSNELDFDIAGGVGASCSSLPGSCSPSQSSCLSGLECSTGCICQIPNKFEIKNPSPSSGCTDSCTNAVISFETSKQFDNATAISTNIILLSCNDDTCSTTTPVENTLTLLDAQTVNITPTSSLSINKRYKVVIMGGASGLKSSDGKTIYNINGIYNNAPAYSWTFKTGSRECAVSRVEISPSSGILYPGMEYTYTASAYSISNSCSSSGQAINQSFDWSDGIRTDGVSASSACFVAGQDESHLSVTANTPNSTARAVASFNQNERQELPAWVCAKASDVIGAIPVTLKPMCKIDTDCVSVGCSSSCDTTTGACNPNMTDFNPKSAKIGTWITIDGCYFGNDWGEVKIGGSQASRPNSAICGNTWTNNQIIAEVASGGSIEVIRQDGNSATSASAFTINSSEYPTVCRVLPSSSRQGAGIEIKGNNFGSFLDFSSRLRPGTINPSYGVTYSSSDDPSFYKTTDNVYEKSGCPSGGWGPNNICIKVHDQAPIGDTKIKVVKNGAESAGYNFKIIDSSVVSKGAKNLSLTGYTPGEGNLACPNMIVEVFLSGELDLETLGYDQGEYLNSINIGGGISGGSLSSLGLGNFFIVDTQEMRTLSGEIYFNTTRSRTSLSFVPDEGELKVYQKDPASKRYWIVVIGESYGLRSSSGGVLVNAGFKVFTDGIYYLEFDSVNNAGDAMCKVSSFEFNPSSPVYTCAGDSCEGDVDSFVGNQVEIQAMALNGYGQSVAVRDTNVKWTSSDSSVVSVRGWGTPPDLHGTFTVNPKNGKSILKIEFPDAYISGSLETTVFLCENPWPSSMKSTGEPFSDSLSGTTSKDPKTNFSTFYCRDKGEQGFGGDLPELNFVSEISGRESARSVNGLLKEIFLTQPNSDSGAVDAIGIRVLSTKTCTAGLSEKIGNACSLDTDCGDDSGHGGGVCSVNVKNHSIKSWYENQGIENAQPNYISVDGFSAIQDRRTVYVSAINDTQPQNTSASGSVLKNIYLVSINDKASPDTIEIYNQIIKNLSFLKNITDYNEEEKLRRDLKRVEDAYFMANLLNQKSVPVALKSGSFKEGASISLWPSWKDALSLDLGSVLPIDPVNKINCPGFEPYCYDKSSDSVICSGDFSDGNKSTYYSYFYDPSIKKATFGANLEYGMPAKWSSMFFGTGWSQNSSSNCQNMKYEKSWHVAY